MAGNWKPRTPSCIWRCRPGSSWDDASALTDLLHGVALLSRLRGPLPPERRREIPAATPEGATAAAPLATTPGSASTKNQKGKQARRDEHSKTGQAHSLELCTQTHALLSLAMLAAAPKAPQTSSKLSRRLTKSVKLQNVVSCRS